MAESSTQVEIEQLVTQAAGFLQQGGGKNEHARVVPSEC